MTTFAAGLRADYLVTSVGVIESDGVLLEFDVNEASVAKDMMVYDISCVPLIIKIPCFCGSRDWQCVSGYRSVYERVSLPGVAEFILIPANRSGSGESFAG